MMRFALIAALALILAGCGGSHGTATPGLRPQYPVVVHSPMVLPVKQPSPHPRPATQIVSQRRLEIATAGSSSCPSVPDELVILSPRAIRIHLVSGSWDNGKPVAHPPPSGICTADRGTTPMLVAIDGTIDVHRPLTVRFFYDDSKKPLVRIAAPVNG
jgi:hypothetical protein